MGLIEDLKYFLQFDFVKYAFTSTVRVKNAANLTKWGLNFKVYDEGNTNKSVIDKNDAIIVVRSFIPCWFLSLHSLWDDENHPASFPQYLQVPIALHYSDSDTLMFKVDSSSSKSSLLVSLFSNLLKLFLNFETKEITQKLQEIVKKDIPELYENIKKLDENKLKQYVKYIDNIKES